MVEDCSATYDEGEGLETQVYVEIRQKQPQTNHVSDYLHHDQYNNWDIQSGDAYGKWNRQRCHIESVNYSLTTIDKYKFDK
jgi:hypothetical protein